MVLSNLSRRKGRTLVTWIGITIGTAAIIALGAMAKGARAGFTSMTEGSRADLVLAQVDRPTILFSSLDEAVVTELQTWPEVAAAEGVLFANVQTEKAPSFFIFGHDPNGFSIAHFRIIEGKALADARGVRGTPLILGRRAARDMDKQVGDTFHVTGGVFRIVGIYETGDSFEDGSAVVSLAEAQALTLQPRRVSMVYIKLRSALDANASVAANRVRARVARRMPDMAISSTSEFTDQEQLLKILDGVSVAVAALAIVIGGVVLTNTLLMSVFERTQEIGLLRALGWRRRRVMLLILAESLSLSLLGGLAGTLLGAAAVLAFGSASWLVISGMYLSPDLLVLGLATVTVLGLVGGAYPAWWASRLLPVEALRHEGSGQASVPRFLPGGMIVRGLWRRRIRTSLTLLGIGVAIAAIVALGSIVEGTIYFMTRMWQGSQTDLVAIQTDVSDVGLSAIDERVGARIAAHPEVAAVSGCIATFVAIKDRPMVVVFGYDPNQFAIRHFRIVEGQPLTTRHETIVGRQAAEQMGVKLGDTLRLLQSNFRVVGIYETGLPHEEVGLVISLAEMQTLTGKPRQVMWYGIKLRDAQRAEAVQTALEATFQGITFSRTSELAERQSQFQQMKQMVGNVSSMAVLIGGLGMLNTMLMSVLERTHEIGVLRAVGWRRRQVLAMILQESLVLGALGGVFGILVGLGLSALLGTIPMLAMSKPVYPPQIFVQAIVVALVTGVIGGLYPAWRAARMQPAEALRYE